MSDQGEKAKPVKPRRRRRRADGIATRERVLQMATSLFASSGYEATSLRQIAAASGIDIATLKYHFDDKAALFAMVYEAGHTRFLEAIVPLLQDLEQANSRQDVRELIERLVSSMQCFVGDNLDFVRLVLFRLLEDSSDIIGLEDDLQTVAIGMMEDRFQALIERGVIEPIDARALVAFLISSFAMWQVTARVKKHWVGEPGIETPEGRLRSERYFVTAITRILGVEEKKETCSS